MVQPQLYMPCLHLLYAWLPVKPKCIDTKCSDEAAD